MEDYLVKRDDPKWTIPFQFETPMRVTYKPELDVILVLSPEDGAHYQSLIRTLKLMVKLGRINICLEVPMMPSYLDIPREGYMVEFLRIFGHLRKYHNTELMFDPRNPTVDELAFEMRDWSPSEFDHVQGKEGGPSNMP
eukprot:11821691-Ditylum_brightwellii.AAC.1